jgi:hypothetical protein
MKFKGWITMGLLSAMLALAGCDNQRIAELVPGESTEADVRQKFGQPQDVWEDGDGTRILEFSRQPEGHRNWQIKLDAQGKLVYVKNVLTPENLAKIQPGMSELEVRRLVGRPGKMQEYKLKNEVHWDYRFLESPTQSAMYIVTFDGTGGKVKATARMDEPKDVYAPGK